MATIRLAFLLVATSYAVTGANGFAPTKPADDCGILPRAEMRLRLSVTSPLVSEPTEIQRIVDQVWAAEGLRFRWLPADAPLNSWNELDAWIVVGPDRVHPTNPEAIGSVQFGRDGVPSRLIRLSVTAAQAWVVAAEARNAHLSRQFVLMRTQVPLKRTTRALGYAAAHEVGHFVLASKDHSGDGLMQAAYRDPHKVALEALRLDVANRRRLQDRLAAAALCR